jgi:hypothetical protein
MEVAKKLTNRGMLIVAVRPDLGKRYLSTKLYQE